MVEGAPKSKASKRTLPLPDCVLPALRRHMDRREQDRLLAGSAWKETGRLFTTTIGTPLDLDKLTRVFHAMTDEAKVPRIRVHDLRHTCGTFLHANGVSPFTIQEILGHSQLATTRRYTHAVPSLQKAALDKVGELLSPHGRTGETKLDSSGSTVNATVKPRLVRAK